MITFSTKQMRLLSVISLRNYKLRVFQHIKECFPEQYVILGEECVRVIVDLDLAISSLKCDTCDGMRREF